MSALSEAIRVNKVKSIQLMSIQKDQSERNNLSKYQQLLELLYLICGTDVKTKQKQNSNSYNFFCQEIHKVMLKEYLTEL